MRILGVNNYQARKDSKVNFGMKSLTSTQLSNIGMDFYASLPIADKIVAHIERRQEVGEVLQAVFAHLRQYHLFTASDRAHYAAKVLDNSPILAYSFKQGATEKFGPVQGNDENDFIIGLLDALKPFLSK